MMNPQSCILVPSNLLAAYGIGWRQETAADHAFLLNLFEDVRWPELAASGWTDAQKHHFLGSQFYLQTAHYHTHYTGSQFWIITCHGQPIGRLYLFQGPGELRIVDISVLSPMRGQGFGGQILQIVQDYARHLSLSVTIHVECYNPAQTLYVRLGFQKVEQKGPYWLMQWVP